MLAITGAADTVSTVLRQTIRQLVTPNHLRGRMTSINMMFFMGGPQLGELEAGVVAGAYRRSAFSGPGWDWFVDIRCNRCREIKESDGV